VAAFFETFLADPVPYDGYGIYPVPPETHHQCPLETTFSEAEPERMIRDLEGRTEAWLLRLRAGAMVRVRHSFVPEGEGCEIAANIDPPKIWRIPLIRILNLYIRWGHFSREK
jgi:hypothetical protein